MTDNCDLCAEVRDQDLVVTMPGTSLRVVYRKPHRGSQLVARLDYFQDQQKGPITRAEFLASWRTHEMSVRSRTRRLDPPCPRGRASGQPVSVLRPASLFWEYIAGDALNPLLALVFRRKSATVLNFLWEPKRCSVV